MMKERDVARHAHVVDPVCVSRPDAAGECGSDVGGRFIVQTNHRTTVSLEERRAAVAQCAARGGRRQPRPHPLFEEVRRHRATLVALLTNMRLPAATEEVGPKATSLKAWRAARSHWLKEVR